MRRARGTNRERETETETEGDAEGQKVRDRVLEGAHQSGERVVKEKKAERGQ